MNIPSRFQSKEGPVRSISFRQTSLNMDLALETRRSFRSLFGLNKSFSGKIHPVEGISSAFFNVVLAEILVYLLLEEGKLF